MPPPNIGELPATVLYGQGQAAAKVNYATTNAAELPDTVLLVRVRLPLLKMRRHRHKRCHDATVSPSTQCRVLQGQVPGIAHRQQTEIRRPTVPGESLALPCNGDWACDYR